MSSLIFQAGAVVLALKLCLTTLVPMAGTDGDAPDKITLEIRPSICAVHPIDKAERKTGSNISSGSLSDLDSDWMGGLSDDLRLTELTIPGTHESVSFYGGFWGLADCQGMPLHEQLAWGVRLIDIRCKQIDDSLILFHGDVLQCGKFGPVLQVCTDFLDEHTGETILLRLQRIPSSDYIIVPEEYCDTLYIPMLDSMLTNCGDWCVLWEAGSILINSLSFAQTVQSYLEPKLQYIWQSDNYDRIPTLGELRGKIVILQDFPDDDGQLILGPKWDGPYWSVQDDWSGFCCYADPWNRDLEAKFQIVYGQLEHAYNGSVDSFYVNFLSCIGAAPCLFGPYSMAWGCGNPLADGVNVWMNWWLQDVISATNSPWFFRKLRLGAILMDWIDESYLNDYENSLTRKIIDFNFREFPVANPDWMSRILRESMLISELAIPGTQGSMSGTAEPNEWGEIYPTIPSQSMSLETQLRAGIRAIEVMCQPIGGPFVIILPDAEGLDQELPLEFGNDVLKPIVQFLIEYPTETVLLRVQKKCFFPPGVPLPCDPADPDHEWWETLQWYLTEDGSDIGPGGEFVHYGDYVWQSDDYNVIPTIGEVRGKIVILQDSDSPVLFGIPWSSCSVQDEYVGNNPDLKWQLVQEFQEDGCSLPVDIRINYLSNFNSWMYAEDAGGEWGGPGVWQTGMNKRYYDFLPMWDCQPGGERGIVMMDYPGPGLIEAIINCNDFNLVGVDDPDPQTLPVIFEVDQNYPNPFNPATKIDYRLPRRSHVTIEVYNVLGQKVRTVVDRVESAGTHTIIWDGKSESGQAVASGIYLYRFQAGEYIETKKMLLLQ